MKRIVIGDPHGRWGFLKHIYEKENPDEVIILGDYFDSYDINPYDQCYCYDNIINLRKKHLREKSGNFIMLIGNHDFQYMSKSFGRCSGYNNITQSLASYPLMRDLDNGILQIAYIDEINNTIYSHAGVSQKWFDIWCQSDLWTINTLDDEAFQFTYRDGGDWYGSSSYNSPLWIRPEGLLKSPLKNDDKYWDQIFGHTETGSPKIWILEDLTLWDDDCIMTNYILEELDDDNKLKKREFVKTNMII